jgi:hypothetical protein
MSEHSVEKDTRDAIAAALRGHRLDAMSQDSGQHCKCGSDSRFEQQDGDHPWSSIDEHRADMVLRADVHSECVPKWIVDQHMAQIERLQNTIEQYQQKEPEHDRAAEPGRVVESSDTASVHGLEGSLGAVGEGSPDAEAGAPDGGVGRAQVGEVARVLPPVETEPWCCTACRAEGWMCSASCGRPCCVAEETARVFPPGEGRA